MAYNAKIIEIIIASPGDVPDERQIVREVIGQWNAIYSRERNIVLMPVGWETHSSPELSARPQQLINDRILTHADILVGIFWTRVGSPTGKAISGSIEEIDEHIRQGKPVMLYFSNVPVAVDSVDPAQYEQLRIFKSWAMERGLVEFFESRDDFRNKFQRQLPITIKDNAYVLGVLTAAKKAGIVDANPIIPELIVSSNSEDAREMLKAAGSDRHGMIAIRRYIGGTGIEAGGRSFVQGDDRRVVARWEAAISELLKKGLISDINGDGSLFQITDAGYRLIEAGP